jgi:hypothetical protein
MKSGGSRLLTSRQRAILRTPAGWCRAVVTDPAKGLFYPEQAADISLPPHVLFYIKRKARRCGWSHALTRESVAECHLEPNISVYFVSMNLPDAYKKIEECKRFYYDIHPGAQRPITAQNKTMLRFSHGKGAYSEIHASFRVRGMPGRDIRIKIDEADHIADLRTAIQDATPNIIQGKSYLKIGGTVNRDHGPFWDFFQMNTDQIFDDPKIAELMRKSFMRSELFWWQVPWQLNPEARKNPQRVKDVAPAMATDERVEAFGSDRLRISRAILGIEDFQQEFELKVVSGGASLIDWDLILKASDDPKHEFLPTTSSVMRWAQENGAKLFAGFDVGRTENTSELSVFGYFERLDFPVEIYKETYDHVLLPTQTERLKRLLKDDLPTLRMAIDMNGLGREMAETLALEFPGRVIPTELEQYQRSGILDAYASRFAHGKIKIVADQERRQQISSIKRRVSEAGRTIYYVSRKEKHHADVAISQALAIHAISANSLHATWDIEAGGILVGDSHNELDELVGGGEELYQDVINV